MIGPVKILASLTAHQCFFIQNLAMLYISIYEIMILVFPIRFSIVLSEVYKVTLLLLALGLDKTV